MAEITKRCSKCRDLPDISPAASWALRPSIAPLKRDDRISSNYFPCSYLGIRADCPAPSSDLPDISPKSPRLFASLAS
jgi:hypothetical protein